MIAYTTYDEEKFLKSDSNANPRARIPSLGCPARDPVADEWEKDQMFLNIGDEIRITHKKIKMTRNDITGVLEGTLAIK